MTQSDTITPHTLRFERVLPAPIETVWRYLVDPDLRARWFMGGKTDPRVGGEFELVMAHDALSDRPVPTPPRYADYVGARWSERITRIEPPHVIAFTWEGGAAGEVTIELAAAGDGTHLTLTHRGIPGRAEAANFGGGWLSHLAVLEKRLANEGVPDFWALHADAERRVEQALG